MRGVGSSFSACAASQPFLFFGKFSVVVAFRRFLRLSRGYARGCNSPTAFCRIFSFCLWGLDLLRLNPSGENYQTLIPNP